MTVLRVAVVQQHCFAEKQRSLAASEQAIRRVAAQGAKLVLLQELHAMLYFCQTETTELFELAETIPGPSTDFLGALAKELSIVIVGSIFEKRAAGIFHNTAVVFEKDGSIAGIYRKMHIPDDPAFYEKFYFTPGDAQFNAGTQFNTGKSGFTPIETSVGKLGVLVCWDQWYPEAARLMALSGADLLLYPTAIGWDPDDTKEEQERQRDAWVTIQRSHAVANHLPVLVANRVCHEPDPSGVTAGIQFWGTSFIAGPQGNLLQQADTHSETELVADIDFARTEYLRRIWPYFRDRRIDAYGNLLKRYVD